MPLYTNFADAWSDFVATFPEWQDDLDLLDTQRSQMMSYAEGGYWLNAFSMASACFSTIRTIHMLWLDMAAFSWMRNHFFASIYYAFEGAVAPEIDMSAILKAMAEAEPHQPLLFIAYLEAYQASVWNASFDERFFADLVKKWSVWG